MQLADDELIACTLPPGNFKERTDWIRALAKRSLRHAKQDSLALHLTYGAEAAAQVRELVAKEQSCCAFLHFDLQETATEVHLKITAPEKAREAAEILFAHFAPDLASSGPVNGKGTCCCG